MKANTSERNDLIHIYLLNVEDIYKQFTAAARCIAKRTAKNLPVRAEVLAKSEICASLQRKLNLYSVKYDGIRCAESGDRILIAHEIMTEAEEIALNN